MTRPPVVRAPRWRSLLPALICLLGVALGACTSIPVEPEQLRQSGIGIDADNYYCSGNMRQRFGDEWARGESVRPPARAEAGCNGGAGPRLGLALAGGGTKAADFSMGVIQGLEETGVLAKTDILSSVSGGSYAALWYYARMTESGPAGLAPFLADCLPGRYGRHLPDDGRNHVPPPCPRTTTVDGESYRNFTNFVYREASQAGADDYRHQNYIRGYQDVFSNGNGLQGKPSFNYSTNDDHTRLTQDIGNLVGQTAVASLVNIIPNILFDWEMPISPSREAYDRGIRRTFGATAPRCDPDATPDHCGGRYGTDYRAEGQPALAATGSELRFDDVKRLYEQRRAPLWIVNATAGEDRSPWDFTPQAAPSKTVFEFTPYASGSGIYGYRKGQPDRMSPFEATAASAAFFDSQQKTVGKGAARQFLAGLMNVSTLNWGVSHANPGSLDELAGEGHAAPTWQDVSPAAATRLAVHRLLPWPFYYLHKFNAGKDSAFIHLSDGGQAENLGAYALVRRGVDTLILSDHAYDRGGLMEDVCRLKRELAKVTYNLLIPGLGKLDEVCNPDAAARTGYNIFDWNHPVLLGCIVPQGAYAAARPEEVCARIPVDWRTGKARNYSARLIVIKPVLANGGVREQVLNVVSACRDGKPDECHAAIARQCGKPLPNGRAATAGESASCELLGFVPNNFFTPEGIVKGDKCPHFPQFSTVTMTINSSPWMYGALRELARYYARQASRYIAPGTGLVDVAAFNEDLRRQARSPIPSQPGHSGLLYTLKAGTPGDCLNFSAPEGAEKFIQAVR